MELQEVPVCLFLQPVEICLNGSTPIWCSSLSFQIYVISNLAEAALRSIIQVKAYSTQ